ncbi:hypothetical protein [Streptomyces sp. NBC_00872]|uniref:hypothetical protein n=1 Tax=Streptomyces sp. NBC_00872 TaxID=2903686 RepID=UPI002F916C69|nr:hypothetical protein OG214_38215 [Streptomyces sp. NBC_00872]
MVICDVPTCPDLLTQLRREGERITRAIEDLQASRAILGTVITAAPSEGAGTLRPPQPGVAEAS